MSRHFFFSLLQAADHPPVGSRKRQWQGLIQTHILALAIHQHETRGVPQLVAEVAVTVAALQIKLDVTSRAGEAGKGEAQCIGTKGGDAFGEFLACFLCYAFRLPGIHQPGGALLHQFIQRDAIDQIYRI